MSVGRRLLDVPFPEMVYKLAHAIAESQHKLDMASIDILRIMGDKGEHPVFLPKIQLDPSGDLVEDKDDNIETSMIGAGFQPTFYQFAETVIEVQMTISMTHERAKEETTSGEQTSTTTTTKGPFWNQKKSVTVLTTPIEATYSSTYNFSQEGSSSIRTRLVPVPPNPFIQRLLEMKSQAMQNAFEVELRKIELAIEKEQLETAGKLRALEE